jgi:hypothetical protein
VVALLVLFLPLHARGDTQAGMAAYAAHDYHTAAEAFQAAYRADPNPSVLYSWAQAERLDGNCALAVILYRKLLDSYTSGSRARAVHDALAKCGETAGQLAQTPAEPVPEPQAQAQTQTPATPAAETTAPAMPLRPAARPFYRDPLGDVLFVSGLVGVGVGVAYLIAADNTQGGGVPAYDAALDARDRAHDLRLISGVALGVGAGLLVTGIVRWAVWSRAPNVAVTVDERMVGMAFSGRF